MGVSIFEANLDMCKEIALVKKQVWESAYRGIYPDCKIDGFDIDKEAEKFAGLVTAVDIKLYVAVVDNKIVGYMAYGRNPRTADTDCKEIVLLSVLKEYQGKGIGKMLFEFGKEGLKNQCDHFIIHCNKYNTNAQKFYAKMGCTMLSTDADNPDRSIPQTRFIYRF